MRGGIVAIPTTVPASTAISVLTTERGIALERITDSTERVEVANAGIPTALAPTNAITAIVIATVGAGNTANGDMALWSRHHTTATLQPFRIFQSGTVARTFKAGVRISGVTRDTPVSAAVTLGTRVCFVLRWRSGEAVTLVMRDMATQALIETTSSGVGTGTIDWTGSPFYLAQAQNKYECAFLFRDKLTDTEVRRIMLDPYGMFRKRANATVRPLTTAPPPPPPPGSTLPVRRLRIQGY